MGRVVEKIVIDVDPQLKRRWIALCERNGVKQPEMIRRIVEKEESAMMAIMVNESNGTYEITGAAETEDWLDVRTAALGDGAEIDEGTALTGWGQYTRVYHITYPSGDVLTYFVAE